MATSGEASSSVPSETYLETAKKFLENPETAKKPAKLQLASLIVEIKKQRPVQAGGETDYKIVKLLAGFFDKLNETDKKEHTKLITVLNAWTGLEIADTTTRQIVRIAAKQLEISPSRLPKFFIKIHERFKTIAMAFNACRYPQVSSKHLSC